MLEEGMTVTSPGYTHCPKGDMIGFFFAILLPK
jgi:hypothetical protein